VLGPIDHGFCKSIYFHDLSGHRLEFAANKLTFKMIERLSEAAQPMLEEWTRTHKVVRHSAWVHEKELGDEK
jgi:lactoylglutathione lyase